MCFHHSHIFQIAEETSGELIPRINNVHIFAFDMVITAFGLTDMSKRWVVTSPQPFQMTSYVQRDIIHTQKRNLDGMGLDVEVNTLSTDHQGHLGSRSSVNRMITKLGSYICIGLAREMLMIPDLNPLQNRFLVHMTAHTKNFFRNNTSNLTVDFLCDGFAEVYCNNPQYTLWFIRLLNSNVASV